MVVQYNPNRPLFTTFFVGRTFYSTCRSPMFLGSQVFFIAMQIGSHMLFSDDELGRVEETVTYPATLLATLFSFLLGLFTNNCYQRFIDHWQHAMKGWSRMNDLAMQTFAYVKDRNKACEIMRLMHAANHLCYGEFAGRDEIWLAQRRNLLTDAEAAVLRRADGPSPFYLCVCWALELVEASDASAHYIHAMDYSIREWRQSMTYLPVIQFTPLPLPYYQLMIMLSLLFEATIALKMAVSTEHDTTFVYMSNWQAAGLSLVLFSSISLIVQTTIQTSIQ